MTLQLQAASLPVAPAMSDDFMIDDDAQNANDERNNKLVMQKCFLWFISMMSLLHGYEYA